MRVSHLEWKIDYYKWNDLSQINNADNINTQLITLIKFNSFDSLFFFNIIYLVI